MMSPRFHVFGSLLLACSLCTSAALAEGVRNGEKPVAKQSNAIVLANVAGPSGGVAWGRAETTLDARPSEVLEVLHDYGRYAGLFPHFEKSRVLSRRGTDAIVYLEARILHGAATLWGQVRMSSRSTAADTYVVEAKMMKGKGNIAQLLARWEVRPMANGERAQVVFQLLVDPDLPVPDSLVSSEMKNSAGRALRALRTRVGQRSQYAARSASSI
jgi:ribosome-associated toxin RatA of RatAB toxin-antitoxin module